MKAYAGAVLVAAGTGSRLKNKVRKARVRLGGKALFEWSLQALLGSSCIGEVCLVAHEDDCKALEAWAGRKRFGKRVGVVAGGEERQDSVGLGLAGLKGKWAVGLVHDSARPFLSGALIEFCAESAMERGSGIAAVEVKDSIKQVKPGGKILSLPRSQLWAAQTPQAARLDWLVKAHQWASKKKALFTDEAGLLEAFAKPVHLVKAYYENLKITTPEDLLVAKQILPKFRW